MKNTESKWNVRVTFKSGSEPLDVEYSSVAMAQEGFELARRFARDFAASITFFQDNVLIDWWVA